MKRTTKKIAGPTIKVIRLQAYLTADETEEHLFLSVAPVLNGVEDTHYVANEAEVEQAALYLVDKLIDMTQTKEQV